jgi:pseudouridine synthase
MPTIRLAKILAQAGLSSRRGADALIAAGRVRINGTVRADAGAQADPERDLVTLDGRPVPVAASPVYLLLNKPRGYVTSRRDPEGRPVVLDLLPPGGARLFPVGRLDYDTEGLLLLTNDGELANRLLHPRHEVARVYQADVEGRVRAADLPRWRRGVTLHDGPARPRTVVLVSAENTRSRLHLSFGEGRRHEVKRFCQALGHRVLRLRRIAFGPLRLEGLATGRYRVLTPAERAALRRLRGP